MIIFSAKKKEKLHSIEDKINWVNNKLYILNYTQSTKSKMQILFENNFCLDIYWAYNNDVNYLRFNFNCNPT